MRGVLSIAVPKARATYTAYETFETSSAVLSKIDARKMETIQTMQKPMNAKKL